jgi:predicted alpha/beta hydrolase family esterase
LNWPEQIAGFGDTPMLQFDFPSTVVMSENDPYASVEHTKQLALAWGSRIVHIGKRGHISADSGLGEWKEGFDLLQQLRAYRPASQYRRVSSCSISFCRCEFIRT